MKKVAVCTLLLLAFGCARSIAFLLRLDCDQVPGRHFPGTTFDTWEENLVSAHLGELGEPAIFGRFTEDRVFRLTITPHDSPPLAITMMLHGVSRTLRVAYYAGAGGWCPSEFPKCERAYSATRLSRPISAAEATSLLEELDRFDFWARSIKPDDAPENIVCLHTTEYVLEAHDHGKYHHIYRDSCSPTTKDPHFQSICRQLIAYAPETIRDTGYCGA